MNDKKAIQIMKNVIFSILLHIEAMRRDETYQRMKPEMFKQIIDMYIEQLEALDYVIEKLEKSSMTNRKVDKKPNTEKIEED